MKGYVYVNNEIIKSENSLRIGAIVEVRMTSSRLPGKHLLMSRSEPMISRLIRRIRSVKNIDQIIIATTTNWQDDVFESIAQKAQVSIFRGSEHNVMERVLYAALENKVDVICEITGDCPLVDPELTETAIKKYLAGDFDYITNGLSGLPDGLGCQVFSTKALSHSYSIIENNEDSRVIELDKEHVTSHMQRHPGIFKIHKVITPEVLNWPTLSLSLDEQMDFEILNEVIESLEPLDDLFSTEKVVNFFKSRPDLVAKNKMIYRRGFE
jgi:spore coat polysaccharide biosynthesis protein SpsF